MKSICSYSVCSGLVWCKRQVTEGKRISCTKERYDYGIREVHPHEDQLDKHTIMHFFSRLEVYV